MPAPFSRFLLAQRLVDSLGSGLAGTHGQNNGSGAGDGVTAGVNILLGVPASGVAQDPAVVVVERNGQIVPAADFAATSLCADDVLELVQFVGGG